MESQGKAYTDLADASTGISPQQDNGQRKEKLRGYGTLSHDHNHFRYADIFPMKAAADFCIRIIVWERSSATPFLLFLFPHTREWTLLANEYVPSDFLKTAREVSRSHLHAVHFVDRG